ncbi:class I SAM-dependent methyltransferase [Thiomicrospira aerophila]|nr:DUF4942 domain-containing protein [Thiomicrospira aerophila]
MSSLLEQVKLFNEDYEWYPTTNEQIDAVYLKLKQLKEKRYSLLDIGAGNGKVLSRLTDLGSMDPSVDGYNKVIPAKKYAIEKSKPLIDALPEDVFLVGCDFYEQTLIDKKVNVIFSNPPYSQFSEWAVKIIKEARASHLFMVLPKRWVFDQSIHEALGIRKPFSTKKGKLGYEILGSFDYHNAEDRKARAKVDVIYISLGHDYYGSMDMETDPFNVWFNESFSGLSAPKSKIAEYERKQAERDSMSSKIKDQLVKGDDLVQVLVSLYESEMSHLFQNYKSVSELDADILRTLDVNIESIKEALKQRIESMKDRYWRELFDKLDKITSKLTHDSRKVVLDTLTCNTSVDFNHGNIYAVLSWVFKNANKYFDSQLVDTYERMIEKANIVPYKSNQRVFADFDWRYNRKPDDLTHFKLDYRIVLERVGGICNDSSRYGQERFNGLSQGAANLIDDLCTIASNLGFVVFENHKSFFWNAGNKNAIRYRDAQGIWNDLLEVRAFKNGNLHLRLSSKFAAKLNVEFGRLKGWLTSASSAASEIDISDEDALDSFRSNYVLTIENANNLIGFRG